MKIKLKLLIIFLLIALVPIAIVSFISIYSFHSVLERSIGENFANTARKSAASIEYIISERIAEVEKLASLPQVKEVLRLKNKEYRAQPQSVAEKKVMKFDAEWIESGGRNDFASGILNSEFSEFLREYQRTAPERYGEIFLTSRMGTTVAMSGTLSDYFQGDEQWWNESFSNGKGRTFLDYRGFDKSVGTLILGVVVPVMDGSEVIGIIKVNYKIKEILDIISIASPGKTFESFLLNSQGDMIAYRGSFPKREISANERDLINKTKSGWEKDFHDGRDTIHAFSLVNSEIFTRIPSPGARKGISGEKWDPSIWYVFLEINRDEAFSSIRSISNMMILIGCLIAAAVIVIAIFISKAISGPIEALTKSVLRVGQGKGWQEVKIQSSDEIGVLSGAFNDMISELISTSVSRDRLIKEVKHREEAEKQIKVSLKEKDILLKEVHHRVKNNLQVVSSILNLQSAHIEDKKLKGIFQESQDRIRSMALVHDQLYQTKDISNISFPKYLRTLVGNIFASYTLSPSQVDLKIDVKDINFDIDTSIVLGIIVNELCTNALKHAFPDGRKGELKIDFKRSDNENYLLTVSDNGAGLSEDLDMDKTNSMGFLLIKSMLKQLDGKLEIDRSSGTSFRITFSR